MSDFETVPPGTLELLEKVTAERDSLMAHVERMPALLDKLTHNLIQMRGCKHQHQIRAAIEVFETDIYEIRRETPGTSLAHLKSEWQAEGAQLTADSIRYVYEGEIHQDRIADHADEVAEQLRRQAEE